MGRIKWPRRNLGAESENWGRSVEQEVETLRGAVALSEQSAANNNKQVNAAINSLQGIVSELQATTEQLAVQQGQILEIVDKLLVVKNANSYGTLTNIYDFKMHYVSQSWVMVPEGYNTCIALNMNSASGGSQDSNPWGAWVHSYIWSGSNTNYGPGGQIVSTGQGDPSSASSMFSRNSLTNLQAGDYVWGAAGVYPSVQVPGASGGRLQVMNSLVCFFLNQ